MLTFTENLFNATILLVPTQENEGRKKKLSGIVNHESIPVKNRHNIIGRTQIAQIFSEPTRCSTKLKAVLQFIAKMRVCSLVFMKDSTHYGGIFENANLQLYIESTTSSFHLSRRIIMNMIRVKGDCNIYSSTYKNRILSAC